MNDAAKHVSWQTGSIGDDVARDEESATDLSRGTLPVSSTWVIVITAVVIVGFLYQLHSKIDRVEVLLEAQEKHNKEIQQILGEKVELQIQNAGLRTTAMQLTDRIIELQLQVKGGR